MDLATASPPGVGATAAPAARASRRGVAIALAVLACWLAWPILFPVHVEGFSASIESIGLHLNAGSIADYDRLFPFNTEYFALSRLGMNLLVAALAGPLGLGGEWAMRVALWMGFALLGASSALFVMGWARVPALAAAAALVLLPGLAESGFFYNDNLLSAGLATAALALLHGRTGRLAAVAAGLLFGGAFLVRADAALVAPAAALILARQNGWRAIVGPRALLFGAAALLSASAVLAAFGVTILDVLAVDHRAIGMWARQPALTPQAHRMLLFIGAPGLILYAMGLRLAVRDRDGWMLAFAIGVPGVALLVTLGTVWEVRQLLPLTPFVAAPIAAALSDLAGRRGSWRPLVLAVVFAAAASVLVAPRFGIMSDGPRWVLGRVWTPLEWSDWQADLRGEFMDIARLADGLDTPESLVVTADWDYDRYVHLALQEAGYRIAAFPAEEEACSAIAERFERDGRSVVHLRLHTPMVPEWMGLLRSRYERLAKPCLAELPAGAAFLLGDFGHRNRFDPRIGVAELGLCADGIASPAPAAACAVDRTKLMATPAVFADWEAVTRAHARRRPDLLQPGAAEAQLAAVTPLLKRRPPLRTGP